MNSVKVTPVNVNSTPAAYIMSHSTFNFGKELSQFDRTYQTLLLDELLSSTIIKIEFLYIDIGCTNNYNNDTGYIQSLVGTEPSFTFTCYNLSSDINVSPAVDSRYPASSIRYSYVGITFNISNDEKIGGFLLKYSGMYIYTLSIQLKTRLLGNAVRVIVLQIFFLVE